MLPCIYHHKLVKTEEFGSPKLPNISLTSDRGYRWESLWPRVSTLRGPIALTVVENCEIFYRAVALQVRRFNWSLLLLLLPSAQGGSAERILIQAFSDFKAFSYSLIGGFS